ncbi:MAG TPA: hypothetical protein VIP11_01670, partial [Gemmatimonadaceae bacterium]
MPNFPPQQILPWPGRHAVLLVHGVGDASTGKDGAFPIDAVRQALGADAPNVAIYRVNYDFINDWIKEKVKFEAGIASLKNQVKLELGGGDADKTIAEYTGDVVWPVFSTTLRFAVRDAIIQQLIRIKMDRRETALRRGENPMDYKISIIAHSLGCFHTYEVLAAAASEPAHALQPGTHAFRLNSVILMASPVQVIRTVAKAIDALVPDDRSLASIARPLAIPSEMFLGKPSSCTKRFVALTGSHDPIGGHLLGKQLDWAFMNVPNQETVIVEQRLLDIDTKELTAQGLAEAFAAGGPRV